MTINNTSDAKSLYEAIAEDYDRHMEKQDIRQLKTHFGHVGK